MDKPEGYTNNHADYLALLRESGVTNMFGAGPYLQMAFGLDKHQAKDYLLYWMETF